MFELKQHILEGRRQGNFVKRAKIIGWLIGRYSMTKRTAVDYVDDLVLSDFIKINGENIIPIEEPVNKNIEKEADKILGEVIE